MSEAEQQTNETLKRIQTVQELYGCLSAALTVVHPPLLTDVTHGLYPLMAHRAQLTPCAVERRLRLAIESTWNRGDYDAIARFFGQSVDPERGKPTNREFLCQLQERLTLSARRMERRVG